MQLASSPQRRALACAAAIVLVVAATRTALAMLALSRADALALDSLASACVLVLAAVAVASFSREPLAARLGLGASAIGGGRLALLCAGLVALSHAAEAAIGLLGLSSPGLVRFDDALAGVDPAHLAFPIVGLALGAAFGEELFFRGLLQRGIERRVGAAPAIALASLAFGAAHGDWLHGAATASLGAYLGCIVSRTGSIRPAIAAHAVNNALALAQKSAGLELPASPLAGALIGVGGVTLACVALATLRRPDPGTSLQVPPGSADGASGA